MNQSKNPGWHLEYVKEQPILQNHPISPNTILEVRKSEENHENKMNERWMTSNMSILPILQYISLMSKLPMIRILCLIEVKETIR